jgi:ribonuclease-3 family protein
LTAANEFSGSALAYLGDAVIELMARKKVVLTHRERAGKLNEYARSYVTARAQSAALDKILPILTEEEIAVYKRGRNINGTAIPKSASAGEYRRSTGLEVLFASLYLDDKQERLAELFEAAFLEAADVVKGESKP